MEQLPPAGTKPHPASMLQWFMPGLKERLPPSREEDLGGGVAPYVSVRSPLMRLSAREMHKRLNDGFTHDEYRKLLYAQLEPSEGR